MFFLFQDDFPRFSVATPFLSRRNFFSRNRVNEENNFILLFFFYLIGYDTFFFLKLRIYREWKSRFWRRVGKKEGQMSKLIFMQRNNNNGWLRFFFTTIIFFIRGFFFSPRVALWDFCNRRNSSVFFRLFYLHIVDVSQFATIQLKMLCLSFEMLKKKRKFEEIRKFN